MHIAIIAVFSLFLTVGAPSSSAFSQSSTAPGTTAPNASKAVMPPAQREAIEQVIGEYLREHPEVVIEAIRSFQARQQAEEQNRGRARVAYLQQELEHDPTSPVVGNPNGDVTIVEFFDYRCTYCKRVLPTVQKLLKDDGNIRYVMKEFPILSPGSELGARAGLVVWKQAPAKYFQFHTDLMESKGGMTEGKVLRAAAKLGLNTERILREMQSEETSRALKGNFDLARKLGVRGTPGFVIAGTLVPGAIDLKTLERMVAEARKTGRKPKL